MNNPQYEEEESGGPGLGTLGALLGAGALAIPVTGRPIRRLASKVYEKFGSPFASTAREFKRDAAPLIRTLAGNMTGGASDLAEISFRRKLAEGGYTGPLPTTIPKTSAERFAPVSNKFKPTMQADIQAAATDNPDWADTKIGAKALAGAAKDFFRATPAATKVMRGKYKVAEEAAKMSPGRFNAQTDLGKGPKAVEWNKFAASNPSKKYGLNDDDIDMIGKIYSQEDVDSPMAATLQYLRMIAKQH